MSVVWTGAASAVNDTSLFTETITPARRAKNVLRSSHPGPHSGVSYSTSHIEVRPVGSGANGPSSADIGQSISAIKSGWTESNPSSGEMDGLYIVGRTSGPDSSGSDNSDMSGILVDVQNRGPVGFANVIEASVSNVDRVTFSYTRSINVQVGVVNTLTGGQQSYGFVATAKEGVNDCGLLVQTQGAATWDKYIRCATGGVEKFYVNDAAVYGPALDATFKTVTVTPSAPAVQSGTAYTINPATDHDKFLVLANASAITCTLPNSAQAGFRCKVLQRDPGQITFVGAAGAIGPRNPDSHTKTKGQWAIAELMVASNSGGSAAVWYLAGDTAV